MGACSSNMTPEQRIEAERNRKIDAANREHQKMEAEIVKLLLLGAGESGKSTIFKQMKLLYGVPYTQEDLEALRPVVHGNIMTNIQELGKHAADYNIKFEDEANAAHVFASSGDVDLDVPRRQDQEPLG